MITGWITNKGKIIECETYGHFNVDDETIRKIYNKSLVKYEVNSIADSCALLEESGEHPEWHWYEMANDTAIFYTYEKLFDLGYLRIGKYNQDISVEGLGKWIEFHKYILKELVDKYECKLKIYKK